MGAVCSTAEICQGVLECSVIVLMDSNWMLMDGAAPRQVRLVCVLVQDVLCGLMSTPAVIVNLKGHFVQGPESARSGTVLFKAHICFSSSTRAVPLRSSDVVCIAARAFSIGQHHPADRGQQHIELGRICKLDRNAG